jgi:hypothetical protein
MPNIIKCPECQKSLKLNESLAGKRVRCPACKKPFVVPEMVDELEEVDPSTLASESEEDEGVQAERPVRRSRRQPEDEDEEEARPARRSRREPDEEDEDDEERPRRPRRRRRRPRAPSSSAPLVLGILSLVLCCIPIAGIILGVLARNKADEQLAGFSGSSRYDGARRKQEVAKILGTLGICLSVFAIVLNIVLMIRENLGKP